MAAPNLNAILAAVLARVQEAEDATKSVLVSRFIGFAYGAGLDALGRLVGQPRYGQLDDNLYRKSIRLRIYVNGSSGRPEDLIYVARQWTGIQSITYLDIPQISGAGGNCRLVIAGLTPDDGSLLKFLQSICPAGVRLIDITTSATLVPRRMGDLMGTRMYHT